MSPPLPAVLGNGVGGVAAAVGQGVDARAGRPRVRRRAHRQPRHPGRGGRRLPITDTPTHAAERFAAYADAGATWLVLTAIGDDWHAQWELIAEAATLLDGDAPGRR
jgi:hypothetical protein